MADELKLKEALKYIEILGISTTPNDELFASQEIATKESTNVFVVSSDRVLDESEFSPKYTIVFDSVARLDSTIMTKKGLIGFITIVLGAIKFCTGKEIVLSESTKKEIRRIVITPKDSFPEEIKYLTINDKISYEIIPPTETHIYTYEELWKEIFLKKELPRIENEFINTQVINQIDEKTVFIKDGRLELSKVLLPFNLKDDKLWFNIFGNIKNYQTNLNQTTLDAISRNTTRTNLEFEIYSEMDTKRYRSYINLGKATNDIASIRHEVFKKGIFNFSRVDMLIPNHLDDIGKVIDRYNFISKYLRELTQVFSNNPRFPQNIPIISGLEKYLRSLMGRREIIMKELMRNY